MLWENDFFLISIDIISIWNIIENNILSLGVF
jgi:hypothetical protein